MATWSTLTTRLNNTVCLEYPSVHLVQPPRVLSLRIENSFTTCPLLITEINYVATGVHLSNQYKQLLNVS